MKHFKIASVLTASTLLFSSLAFTSAEATTVSRGYLKHVYATGTTTSYMLTTEIVSSPNARGVIGEENRSYQTRSENNGIVSISTGGTGFIIGDHLIATVAHCVGGANGFADITIDLYGSNGYKTGETLTPVEAHIPVDYTTNPTTIYDYALIVVEEDLSDYTHFSLSYTYDPMNEDFVNAKLYAAGITQYLNGDENVNGRIATGTGNIVSTLPASTDEKLFYTNDCEIGCSGGPVYLIEAYIMGTEWRYSFSAVAIQSGLGDTFNVGPSMNLQVRQFYKNNPNIGS